MRPLRSSPPPYRPTPPRPALLYVLLFVLTCGLVLLLRNVLIFTNFKNIMISKSGDDSENFKANALFNNKYTSATSTSKLAQEISDSEPSIPPTKYKPQDVVIIAYCVYPQKIRAGEPVLGAEYFARQYGPLMFPDKKVVYKTCLAAPSQLPAEIRPESPEGMELLGVKDVHMRFCGFGSKNLIDSTIAKLDSRKVELRKIRPKPFSKDVWNLHIPETGQVTVYALTKSDKVVGPLITRTNREAWHESVPGVAVQFDTKSVKLSSDSFSIHMPYAYESFGRSRWNGGKDGKRTIEHHEESYGKNDMYELRQSVTRPDDFDPSEVRKTKIEFIAMVNSNCRRSMPTSLLRTVFTYLVFEALKKPVHNLGNCPKDPNGSIKAGLTQEQRAALHKLYKTGKGSVVSTQVMFANYKFAICFENNDVNGYTTEKMVTPYTAKSIPVYWGGGDKLMKIFNPKAFVYCNITTAFINDVLQPTTNKHCPPDAPLECVAELEKELMPLLYPLVKPCLNRIAEIDSNDAVYDEMLREPLATVNAQGELTGFWNETLYAIALRTAFDSLGYLNGPEALRLALR